MLFEVNTSWLLKFSGNVANKRMVENSALKNESKSIVPSFL